MNATPPQIAAIGDCCIDDYGDQGAPTVGGNAANVAVQLARLGLPAAFLGGIGNDENGATVLRALGESGVDVSRVREIDGATGVTRIELLDDGERILADEDLGVALAYQPTTEDLDWLAQMSLVHCGSLPDFRATAAELQARDVTVSYDFSTRHEFDDLK